MTLSPVTRLAKPRVGHGTQVPTRRSKEEVVLVVGVLLVVGLGIGGIVAASHIASMPIM
jgi:hypothetical protein